MVVGEVDEEILSGHQLHDGVAQELHPLVVAPGRRKHQEGRVGKRREGGAMMSADGRNLKHSTGLLQNHTKKKEKKHFHHLHQLLH